MGAEGHNGTKVCFVMFRRVHTMLGMAVVVIHTCNPVDTLRKGLVHVLIPTELYGVCPVQGYHPPPGPLYMYMYMYIEVTTYEVCVYTATYVPHCRRCHQLPGGEYPQY
jgi:hypothetical protein